jgi:PPOX class probable F420-dependent enzyme
MSPALLAAGRRRYVSLTTFRSSGVPVATAVWIAPIEDALVVTTGATSGKVKRLRRDPRVELRECSMRGTVAAGAPVVHATADLVEDPDEQHRLTAALAKKYGLQYRGFQLIERLLTRGEGSANVVLRITDA